MAGTGGMAAGGSGGGGGGGSLAMLYATSFEANEPKFEKTYGTGDFSNDPPAGTAAKTGTKVISNSTVTTAYSGRFIQSVDCIALPNDTDPVVATIYGESSNANGTNVVRARIKMLWFTNNICTIAASPADANGTGVVLPTSSYTAVDFNAKPSTGATYFKIRFEVKDDNTAPNNYGDDWAGDDVLVEQ